MPGAAVTIDLLTVDPVAEACREAVGTWVRRGQRLVVLSGERGRGRTTVLRRVADDLAAAALVDCLGPEDIIDCTADLTFDQLLEAARREPRPAVADPVGAAADTQARDDGLLPLPFVNTGRRRVVLLDTAERLCPATFDRLAELQRRLWKQSGPLSLVVTITPELEGRLVAVGETQQLAVAGAIARLRPLSDAELSTVVRRALATGATGTTGTTAGPSAVDERWLEFVIGTADGNPLRALRMARALADGHAFDVVTAGLPGGRAAAPGQPALPIAAQPRTDGAVAPPAYPIVPFTPQAAPGRRRLRRAGLMGAAVAATLAAVYGGLPGVQARVDRLLLLASSTLTTMLVDDPAPSPAAVLQVSDGTEEVSEPTATPDRGAPAVVPSVPPPPPVETPETPVARDSETFRTDAGGPASEAGVQANVGDSRGSGSEAASPPASTTGPAAPESRQAAPAATQTVAVGDIGAPPATGAPSAGVAPDAAPLAEQLAELRPETAIEIETETATEIETEIEIETATLAAALTEIPAPISAEISTATLRDIRDTPRTVGSLARRGAGGGDVPPAPAPAQTAPARPGAGAGAETATTWLDRGEQLLRQGDVAAARPFFRLAAEAGSGQAAGRAGLTYDPLYLAGRGVVGDVADPRLALAWYQVGEAAGDAASADRLSALTAFLKREAAAGNAAAASALLAAGLDG